MNKLFRIFYTFIVLLNIVAPLVLGYLVFFNGYEIVASPEYKTLSFKNDQENITGCLQDELRGTSYCLRDYVQGFYKYNITDDAIDLSFTDLVSRGGDCRDWSNLYSSMLKELNITNQIVRVKNENNSHVFVVANDFDEYCLIDQLSVYCMRLA